MRFVVIPLILPSASWPTQERTSSLLQPDAFDSPAAAVSMKDINPREASSSAEMFVSFKDAIYEGVVSRMQRRIRILSTSRTRRHGAHR